MGIMEWLGFARPKVTDNIRDAGSIFAFGMTNAGERVDEKSALQVATVFACVRLLANSVAQLPLNLYRERGGSKEVAEDHPLQRLLHMEPNPEMTSFTYFETMMMHLLLWGNHYSQVVRDGANRVLGLYPLLPENVEVDRAENGELVYIYHAYTDEKPGDHGGDILFRREDILHIPNTGFNGLIGFSPIAMQKNALGSAIAVEKYGSAFFKNGAQPSGVLIHPDVIEDPERLREQWNAAYGGAGSAHRVAVLEEGVKYQPISLPPEDSQFLSTREYGVEEICRIFNVPPHLVQDLKRATFNNIEHMSIDFVVHSLDPWLKRIERGLAKDLLNGDEKKDLMPSFIVNGLLRGDYMSRMQGYAIGVSNGIMTVNEVRRLEDLNAISPEEGGDYHIVNGTYQQLKDAGAAYGMAQGQGSAKDDSPDADTGEQAEDSTDGPETGKGRERQDAHEKRHAERKRQRRGYTDGWTACGFALPAKEGTYIVALNDGSTDAAGYKQSTGFGRDDVKAWMPLPEADAQWE